MSAWNACVGMCCVIAGVVVIGDIHPQVNGEEHHVVDDEEYEELEGENVNRGEYHHPVSGADESTPLIQHPSPLSSNPARHRMGKGEAESVAETWWWIPEFIISVPLPIILFSHVTMLLLDSMPQTLSDGSSVVIGQFS